MQGELKVLTTLSVNNSPVAIYCKFIASFDYNQIYNKTSHTHECEVRITKCETVWA